MQNILALTNPFRTSWLDTEVESFLKPTFSALTDYRHLPIDILNKDDEYEVRIAAPGLSKDNLKISLDGRRLNVHHEAKEEKNSYYMKETLQQSVYRTVVMPSDIDDSKVSAANFDNGVLKFTIGKSKPISKVKNITIE
jgi:HSP20 family protein